MGVRTMSGLVWTGLGYAMNALGQIVMLAVLARYVGAEDFGVLSATLLIIGIGKLFTLSVVGPAIVQRPQLERRHHATAFWLSLATGLLAAAVTVAIAPVAARFFRYDDLAPVLVVLALCFVLQAPGVVSTSLLQRDLAFRSMAFADVVSFLGYCVVGVTCAVLGGGVWALVAANLAQAALSSLVTAAMRPPLVAFEFDRSAAREIVHYGTGFTAGKVFNYSASQGDYFVIGRTMSAASLGFYSRAYQLVAMPAMLIGQMLDRVLFPVIASFQDDKRRMGETFRRGTELVVTLMAPLSVFLVVLGPEVVGVVLGPKWDPVVAPMQVLALGLVCRTGYKIGDSLARSAGTVYNRAWRQAIYAALVVIGTLVGSHWGITGAAWGVLGAIIANYFSMAALSIATTGLPWRSFASAHVRGLVLGAATAVLTIGGASVLRPMTSSDLAVVAGCGITVGLFLTVGVVTMPRRVLGPDATRLVARAIRRRRVARARLPAPDELGSVA
jgi:PST family polysaccharide transporter